MYPLHAARLQLYTLDQLTLLGVDTDELLQARLGEVAAGVHNKIQCGAITAAAEPAAEPE